MNTNRLAMFLLGATLALGFAFSAYMISTAMIRMRQENMIRVKGLAETKIRSDWATWQARLVARAADLPAGHAELERARAAVEAFFAAHGVAPSGYELSAIRIEPEYKRDEKGHLTSTIERYRVYQDIGLSSADVDLVARLAKSITDLLREGVEVHSYQPAFIYRDLETLKLELLARATQNAYDRADTLAVNSRGKVGSLASASQGVFQITPVDSTDVSDYGTYDTSTIDKSVKAVVTLQFRVQK